MHCANFKNVDYLKELLTFDFSWKERIFSAFTHAEKIAYAPILTF
jgi:hypothetical protein